MEIIILALIATAFYYGKISRDEKRALKRIINQINNIEEIFILYKKLNEYENYLDFKDKKEIKNKVNKIEIPSVYKKLETKLTESKGKQIYNKIHTVSKFKLNLDLYLESYNNKFYKAEEVRYSLLFKSVGKNKLTEEQRISVMTEEENSLIIASAGSGKTSVIVAKVIYLLMKNICKPENILVLAFSDKATKELKERIEESLNILNKPDTTGNEILNIKTFHSLGYSIYKFAGINRPDIHKYAKNPKEFNNFVKSEIENLLLDKNNSKSLKFFHEYITPYKSPFIFKSYGEYWTYLKSNNLILTLNGEIVKSYEECEIANFLYLNQVNYEYEKEYEFKTVTPEYRQYKPDFYLSDYGIYIEHFALDKDFKPPNFFKKGYLESRQWKLKLHKEKKTILIETFSHQKSEGILTSSLKRNLSLLNVKFKALPRNKILEKFNESNKVMGFANLIKTFLNHFKSNELSLREIKDKLYNNKRSAAFLSIFENIYNKYQNELKKNYEIDYTDMIVETRKIIHKTNGLDFTHIIIDEFQDISQDRYKLINEIKMLGPKIKTFCVGDDWQSIYQFSGSDIDIMTQYEKYFGNTKRLSLTKTFRFPQSLADISSKFITRNPNQIAKNISSIEKESNPLVTVCFENNEKKILKTVVDEIGKHYPKKNILVLGRYRHSINNLKFNSQKIKFANTIHSAKGSEEDIVIVLDINSGKYGFPSEIEDDPILELVKKTEDKFPDSEERRLFYVALTRAKKHVYLITNVNHQSSFIRELIDTHEDINIFNDNDLINLNCEECLSGWMLKRINRKTQENFYGCSNHPMCTNTNTICSNCNSGVFLKSRNYQCSNDECSGKPDKICRYCSNILTSTNIKVNKKTKEQFYKCYDCNRTQSL